MNKAPYLVGIVGGDGSGKSALAAALSRRFGDAPVLHEAHYCRPREDFSPEELAHINYDHPDTYDLGMLRAHLRALRWGNEVETPLFDFPTRRRSMKRQTVAPAPVIFVVGMFLFHDEELRAQFDHKIYLDTDADIRVIRRLLQAVERQQSFYTAVEQYMAGARPMHLRYVAPTAAYADRRVTGDGTNRTAEAEIAAYIEAQLAAR